MSMPTSQTEPSWRELAIADFLGLDHHEVIMGSFDFGDRYFNGDVDVTWREVPGGAPPIREASGTVSWEALQAAIREACPHDHQVEERVLSIGFRRLVCQDCGTVLPAGDAPGA